MLYLSLYGSLNFLKKLAFSQNKKPFYGVVISALAHLQLIMFFMLVPNTLILFMIKFSKLILQFTMYPLLTN